MNLPDLPKGHIYFSKRPWTRAQIEKSLKYWQRLVRLEKLTQKDYDSLVEKYFGNLTTISKFEDIEGKRHNVQCTHATDSECNCWCKGKYHGAAHLETKTIMELQQIARS